MSSTQQQGFTPTVSIGMPVYNGEKFLSKALDSLLAQSFSDFELIISDNASTDGTEALCRDYTARDARIKYVRQKENLGALANFEFVLDEATGTYFMWAAADDYYPGTNDLQQLVSAILKGYDFVFPNVDILHESSGKMQVGIMDALQRVADTHGYARASLTINSHQVYSLFRLEVLRAFYHFLDACRGMQCFSEGLFVHAVSSGAKGCYVPESRRVYRRHATNTSSTTTASRLLIDLIKYSGKTIAFFSKEKSLSLHERIACTSIVLWKSFKYGVYLLANYSKQRWNKRCSLQTSGVSHRETRGST